MKSRLLIDVGSTYFKIASHQSVRQCFRDFRRPIYDDLLDRCGDLLEGRSPEDVHICSSANGGLSTLIIALSDAFSLKYAVNTAFNSGINIIDTLRFSQIDDARPPVEKIDVIIVAGAVDGVRGMFDGRLADFLRRCDYNNIVYAGSCDDAPALQAQIDGLVVLDNLIDTKLKINEGPLKTYLTDLYQADIVGREEIRRLYDITANQVYPTPYIVNRALPFIGKRLDAADPFIVIDIGGATTDIHYSTDLVSDNLIGEGGYDRLVFKKLGVYKSRKSLVHTARRNEFVFELLSYLGQTEDILDAHSDDATRTLMQLAIFLVFYKVSRHHAEYVKLRLENLNTVVFTGGITKVLTDEDVRSIVRFFFKKLLHFHQIPNIILDRNYEIWTYGMQAMTPKERP